MFVHSPAAEVVLVGACHFQIELTVLVRIILASCRVDPLQGVELQAVKLLPLWRVVGVDADVLPLQRGAQPKLELKAWFNTNNAQIIIHIIRFIGQV